jgi:tRNA-modifying protein YgfZ
VGVEAGVQIELDGQYRELRESAGWLRRDRATVGFRGPDAAELLQGQLTNDVEALGVGGGCYAALLDRKGHLQGDLRVLRLGDQEFVVGAEPAVGEAVLRHFNLYKLGSDVEIFQPDVTVISVIGPATFSTTGLAPLASEHDHAEAALGGIRLHAVRTDLGVDLVAPAEDADDIAAALDAAGVAQVSAAAAEVIRVETGRPRFGSDMTTSTMPAEAGIVDRAVSFTKGCYIGQETVARLHYRGRPNRLLRGLRLSGEAAAGDAVVLGDREVGTLGTVVLSPGLGPIALAILRREAEPGSTVSVGGGSAEAEVVDLPFAHED